MGLDRLRHEVKTLEDVAEHLVEGVEMALVFDECGTRQIVKVLNLSLGEVALERLDQRQIFLQGDRDLGGFELMKKGSKHAREGPKNG